MKIHSPYLALFTREDVPKITYLGVESGGRSRRHLDHNLLKPGYGGEILPGQQLSTAREIDGKLIYTGGTAECQISFLDERRFQIALQAKSKPLIGLSFRISFAPEITPPSLWAKPCSWERMPNPLDANPFDPQPFSRDFHMPGLISLPEFGLLRCEASADNIIIRETLIPDPRC